MGRVTQYFKDAWSSLRSSLRDTPGQHSSISSLGVRELYDLLAEFYGSNGLYLSTQAALYTEGLWSQPMKPLRNPTYRAVEFYPKKLWPGADLSKALPITTENEAIKPAINQVWKWSNWAQRKQVMARWLAEYGDVFLQVATKENMAGDTDRVYFQLIQPRCVSDIDKDDRDILTYVRIDTPQIERDGDDTGEYICTEVWDMDGYRRWNHEQDENSEISELGKPDVKRSMSDLGIDFIPIVHCMFINEGNERGTACITPVLDKVNELNGMVTRLHQMLFRFGKPTLLLGGGGRDKSGKPLPPPRIMNTDGETETTSLDIEDDTILRLPGDVQMTALVANLNYGAFLDTVNAQLRDIEQDLPELRYGKFLDQPPEISGKAMRIMLSDAIDKVVEVRGNAEAALIRANQMALTIGQNKGLFTGLGDYESGALDHSFAKREVIELSDSERAQNTQIFVTTGVPLDEALVRYAGWNEAEVDSVVGTASPIKTTQEEQASTAVATGDKAAVDMESLAQEALDIVADAVLAAVQKGGLVERVAARG